MIYNNTHTKLYTIQINPFLPSVPTFAVRETDDSRHNGGNSGPPLNPSETIVLSEHYRLGGKNWISNLLLQGGHNQLRNDALYVRHGCHVMMGPPTDIFISVSCTDKTMLKTRVV